MVPRTLSRAAWCAEKCSDKNVQDRAYRMAFRSDFIGACSSCTPRSVRWTRLTGIQATRQEFIHFISSYCHLWNYILLSDMLM